MATVTDRLKHAWNALTKANEITPTYYDYGVGSSYRPDRVRMYVSSERSWITSIYTRIAIDASSIYLKHIRTDENEQFVEVIPSGLNNGLTIEANIDQAGTMFRRDVVMTMFEHGVVAIVPVDTTLDPNQTGGYDIITMRTGIIKEWFPRHVRVNVYNDKTGMREDVVVPKEWCAIIENPLYSVMNESNSTLQRIIRKLNLLDVQDEKSLSGRLDIIIQLPYVIKSDSRREQAEKRRKDIEDQLSGSQYGIAYTDGTEKITQLNRPAENNLLKQIEYLKGLLYEQLGVTEEVLKGTADEKTMLNYYNRMIEPIVVAVTEAMTRTFLTKTARTQMQTIRYFRNPFNMVTVQDFAELSDKLTRNEIASSNEMRSIIGWKPSKDPKADELRNKNLPEAVPPEESQPAKPVQPAQPTKALTA